MSVSSDFPVACARLLPQTICMNSRLLVALALVCFAAFSKAKAWDDGGHAIIARIAYDQLSPEKQQKLTAALAGLVVKDESFADPLRAATWLDHLRSHTRTQDFPGAFQNWHFVRLDFTPTGGAFPRGEKPDPDGKADVIRGWKHARALFVAKKTVSENYLGRSFTVGPREALAILMHLTGDAHQPLHTTSHSAGTDPDDAGGNGVMVLNMKPAGNLHHFWDTAYRQEIRAGRGGVVAIRENPAFASAHNATISDEAVAAIAKDLAAKYKPTAAAKSLRSPDSWVKESHKIGVETGYGKLGADLGHETATLSPDYVKDANEIAAQRLVLAGFRLAAILDELL